MAIVYPTDDLPPGGAPPASPVQGVLDFASQHVILSIVGVVALGLGIGFVVHKLFGGTSSTPSGTTPDITGTDATGPQTLYVPTQNTFENITTTTDSYNSTETTNPPPIVPPVGPIQPILPPNPTPTSPAHARIRAKTTSGSFATWDKTHSGVPIRSSPSQSASVLGLPSFGGYVSLAKAGESPANGWYTVDYYGKTGYLSIADVVGLTT